MVEYLAVPLPTIRRSKSADHLVTTPALASKAQQFLGLNRQSFGKHMLVPRLSCTDPWPIKISMSTPEDITRWLSSHLEDDHSPQSPCDLWEQESDTLPSSFSHAYGRSRKVRHEASDSSLASVYDRHHVPLAISQQTSASVMAGAFPRKASELLDIGERPIQEHSTKKRPSRLDLSRLLPMPKSPSSSSLNQVFKSVPSFLDGILTPPTPERQHLEEPAPSYISGKTKALRRKLTKESLRAVRAEHIPDVENEDEPTQLCKGIRHTLTLSNLYEHYEQTSFRDMMAAIDAMTESAPSPGLAAPLDCTLAGHADVDNAHWRTKDLNDVATTSGASTTMPCHFYEASMINSDMRNYNASVSSGHSQTSKASKTSDRSFKSFDPVVTSVLSLSDSEDGDTEPYTPSVSVFPIPSSGEHAKVAAGVQSQSTLRSMRSHWREQIKQARTSSFKSVSPCLTLPEGQPLRINPRTSSRAKANHNAQGHVSHDDSCVSRGLAAEMTTPTSENEARIDENLDYSKQATRDHDEQQSVPQHSQPELLSMPATLQAFVPLLTSSELSPATFEAYLNHMTNQVKAAQPVLDASMAQIGIAEHESPLTSCMNDSRVMTVTRQEEMLLAALRLRQGLIVHDPATGLQSVDEKSQIRPKTSHSVTSMSVTLIHKQSSQSLTQQKTFDGARYSNAESLCSNTTADTRFTRYGNVIVYLDRTISKLDVSDVPEASPAWGGSFDLDDNKRCSKRSAAHSTADSSARHGWGGHHSSWSRSSSMAKSAASMLNSNYPEQARGMSARQIREEKALRDAYRKLTGLAMPSKAGSAATTDEGFNSCQGQGLS